MLRRDNVDQLLNVLVIERYSDNEGAARVAAVCPHTAYRMP
jgi:hypothetical protein